jgi:hypothetical protein
MFGAPMSFFHEISSKIADSMLLCFKFADVPLHKILLMDSLLVLQCALSKAKDRSTCLFLCTTTRLNDTAAPDYDYFPKTEFFLTCVFCFLPYLKYKNLHRILDM